MDRDTVACVCSGGKILPLNRGFGRPSDRLIGKDMVSTLSVTIIRSDDSPCCNLISVYPVISPSLVTNVFLTPYGAVASNSCVSVFPRIFRIISYFYFHFIESPPATMTGLPPRKHLSIVWTSFRSC